MKKQFILFGLVFCFVFVCNQIRAEIEWPVLKGPYLGQKPPGKTAEPFAPGIVNTGEHDYHSDFYFDDHFFIFKRSKRRGKSRTLVTMMRDGVMNGWGNIYWVNTSFIEELKSKHLKKKGKNHEKKF
jgi:hypothetical protein